MEKEAVMVETLKRRPEPVEGMISLRPMTEEEFVAWCDEDIKAEYIDGEVIVYTPVSRRHDELTWFLGTLLKLFVEKNELGSIHGPEFQVRLRAGVRRVPDLLFINKEHRDILQDAHVEGAPDLAIEIVSPDSEERDWREKYWEYQEAGVKEYWVIDPYSKTMAMYQLGEEERYRRAELKEGIYRSEVVSGFWLRPEWLWQKPLPNVLEIARELGIIP
ncbi:MAG: Uma2 family endonuclease [Anaerolineales bacterium]|nr:Uma2 family endonuclease [Anaerolineales bacterium]